MGNRDGEDSHSAVKFRSTDDRKIYMFKLTLRLMVILISVMSGLVFIADYLGGFSDTALIYTLNYRETFPYLNINDLKSQHTIDITPTIPSNASYVYIYDFIFTQQDTTLITSGEIYEVENIFSYSDAVYFFELNDGVAHELLRIDRETSSLHFRGSASLSPNGEYVAVLARSEDSFRIWIVTLEGEIITYYDTNNSTNTIYDFVRIEIIWSEASDLLYIVGINAPEISILSLPVTSEAQLQENFTVEAEIYNTGSYIHLSPTNAEFIFGNVYGNSIWYLDVTNGEITLLYEIPTDEDARIYYVGWLSDGQYIVWIEEHEDTYPMYIRSIDNFNDRIDYQLDREYYPIIYNVWTNDTISEIFFPLSSFPQSICRMRQGAEVDCINPNFDIGYVVDIRP